MNNLTVPIWNSRTVSVPEVATPNNTYSDSLEVRGTYLVISNKGPINFHVGTGVAMGASHPHGILVEPGASLEFAVGPGAVIKVHAAANTGSYSLTWFTSE
jgi:hypothetical protein